MVEVVVEAVVHSSHADQEIQDRRRRAGEILHQEVLLPEESSIATFLEDEAAGWIVCRTGPARAL